MSLSAIVAENKERIYIAQALLLAFILGLLVHEWFWYALVLAAVGRIEFVLVRHIKEKWPISPKAWVVCGAMMIVAVWGAWEAMRLRTAEHGIALIFLLVLSTALNDISALFGGMYFGKKTPLAPVISPKKTVFGFWTGVAGGAVGFLAFWWVLETGISNTWHVVSLAVLLQPISVGGDLLSSWAKRSLGIKDWGDLLRKHGDVHDRVDSHLAVLAAFNLYQFLFL